MFSTTNYTKDTKIFVPLGFNKTSCKNIFV